MKKFEVAYNFDKRLINYIVENNYQDFVEFVYMPPFWEDYSGAKRNLPNPEMGPEPRDKKVYESHVKNIVDNNLPLCILLQNKKQLLTKEMLEYYVKLGATSFTVNNDETAKMIKEYNSKLRVIASITKKLSYNDFISKDLSMYDYFVLYFPFNRSLETLKKLPKQYKYVLLVNCICGYTCPGEFHWFAGCDENGKELLIGPPCQSGIPNQTIAIFADNLDMFDPYAYGYKLQGREFPVETLKDHLDKYIARKVTEEGEKNYYNAHVAGIEEIYYNVATGNSTFLE
jgi:hypothetical protein